MRTRRLQFGLGSLLVLTAICAFASQWLRKPVVRATVEPVGFVIGNDQRPHARFRVTNTGPDSLWYMARGLDVPFPTAELELNGTWTANPWITGIRPGVSELKPGEARVFDVFPMINGATAVKAGLSLTANQSSDHGRDSPETWVEVWSKPLPVPAAGGTSDESAVPRSEP